MLAATVLIGNSDNKLTQQEWSKFCNAVDVAVSFSGKMHFFGASAGNLCWQNACWVIEFEDDTVLAILKTSLAEIRDRFNQDSIGIIVGSTELV